MAARKWLSYIAAGAATSLALVASVAGCGSSSGDKSAAHVRVTAPVDGSVVRSNRVTIRGTVSPGNAAVQVLGQPAQVDDSVFSSSVSLQSGANHIDVVATAPGASPNTTAVTVIRSKRGSVRPQKSGGTSTGSGGSGGV